MKVKFEVEITDYEIVDVPVYYETNIMNCQESHTFPKLMQNLILTHLSTAQNTPTD